MKIKVHTLKISRHSVAFLLDQRSGGSLTDEVVEKLKGRPYYSGIQCSFMNLYKNSAFRKL